MGKFVTATAIATLVDRSTDAQDAPVSTYSPDTVLAVPYGTDNATLRDYLAHRTGLPANAAQAGDGQRRRIPVVPNVGEEPHIKLALAGRRMAGKNGCRPPV
jgi:CubicO group peptidase (beta-lactamase class C family)